MAVRNCQELGENLQKIVQRLLANDDLVKLLYYTDKDPLSQPVLTAEQKSKEVFEQLIKIVPKVVQRDDAKSILALKVIEGTKSSNEEFRDIKLSIEIFVPLTQWIFKNSNLRPFAILGEIQKSLNNKTINGLGKLSGGDFSLSFLTEEMSCYEILFRITEYD